MVKRIFYEKDKAIEVKLNNRRLLIEIKGDNVVVISRRLVEPNENLKDFKRAGFRVYRDKVAYFKYVVSIEAFEEIMQAYLYLKDLEDKK